MIKRISSISDQNCPTTAHFLFARCIKSMKSTSKADKYVRFLANTVKLIRTATPETKQKYSKLYKNILVLRQIFRWQGLYEALLQINDKGWDMFKLRNINNLTFILFEMFGDTLDRMMFFMEILGLNYPDFYGKVEQMQSNCYFIGCVVWLQYHLRTFKKVWENGKKKQKLIKILKIVKYFIDSLTSYCKFSMRIWELQTKNAAILGIISSVIGLYEIFN